MRLTTITTPSGKNASSARGPSSERLPCCISAGSNSRAIVARSRTSVSFATALTVTVVARKVSPARLAATSRRRSHHNPNPSMIAEAISPNPGAANGDVPKCGIGMAF